MINLQTPLKNIPKINFRYRQTLERLGIRTIHDLLSHFPFRYDDYTETVSISNLQTGLVATIEGEIIESRQIRTWKKRMRIAECHIKDNTGYVRAVWFNQPFVANSLTKEKRVRISGKVSSDKNGMFFSNPSWENSTRQPTNTGRLVPVYPETEGLTSKWLRWQIQTFLRLAKNIPDPVPKKILQETHLPSLSAALQYIHFPKTEKEYLIAQKRFAFQEMLTVQITSAQIRNSWKKQSAEKIPFNPSFMENFTASLPFELTNAQKKSVAQIFKDLEKDQPMNRLLNGDVGSGKTLVAAMAALSCAKNNFQVALMAPTEVLARQHFESISKLFEKQKIPIALLTNSYKQINNFENSNFKIESKLNRNNLLDKIKSGDISIIIGTHAIIQKDIR
ncbi:MAG TPA: DNA helicase RecG, partial [Candidatus Moranbacteria bacterium]|nr:DNA helicase RecG [Candidatus Moranbacteria bacterium]